MSSKRSASVSGYPFPKRINLEQQNSDDFSDEKSQKSVQTNPETFTKEKEEIPWLDEMLQLAREICKLSEMKESSGNDCC